jgi:hypothetical protein
MWHCNVFRSVTFERRSTCHIRKVGPLAARVPARGVGEKVPAVLSQPRRDHKSTSPRSLVDLAEIISRPRRDQKSTSPRSEVNLAEIMSRPRRDQKSTSPRSEVNLAEIRSQPRRDYKSTAISAYPPPACLGRRHVSDHDGVRADLRVGVRVRVRVGVRVGVGVQHT